MTILFTFCYSSSNTIRRFKITRASPMKFRSFFSKIHQRLVPGIWIRNLQLFNPSLFYVLILVIASDIFSAHKVVIMLKAMAFLELISQKFKSWARKNPPISECKLRLKKVVIGEIQLSKNTR